MRFTFYLSAKERNALKAVAESEDRPESYIVRLAIRHLLGMSLPQHALDQVARIKTRTTDETLTAGGA